MRQARRSAVVAIALVLIGASTAQAVQMLYTAAQTRSGRQFSCRVVNTGTRDVTVTTQAVDIDGNVDASQDHVIEPGAVGGFLLAQVTGSPILYCKFIVTAGNKASLRASYCVHDADLVCQASGDAR